MKISRKKILLAAIVLFITWISAGYIFSNLVTAAKQKNYNDIRLIGSFPATQITIKTQDGISLNAWLAGNNKKSIVILLAGIGGNSSQMTGRAEIYLNNGYSVLLPDLRGTGKSGGDRISFGWNEKNDLVACYKWLKARHYENIAAHGCSLGAATIAYSLDSIRGYNFLVLESSYDNIDHAFAHRTFDSGFNRLLFWPAYFFTEMKINADVDQLSPESRVSEYKGRVLYFSGDREKQIRLKEMWNIYKAIGSEKKSLHIFKGAEHVDFLQYDPAGYKSLLTTFLYTIPNGK